MLRLFAVVLAATIVAPRPALARVPPAWISRPIRSGISLMWWTVGPDVLRDAGAYFGWGYGGQYLFVFPKTRTVAVLNQSMLEGKEIQPIAFARRIERAVAAVDGSP